MKNWNVIIYDNDGNSKEQRDRNGNIIYYTYNDAQHTYKKLRAKGIKATMGKSVGVFK